MKDYSQIAYFPYLNMEGTDEIDLGFVKIWNFDQKAEFYIPNKKFRDKVKLLLSTNVYNNGHAIKNIGIIQFPKNKEFHCMSDEETSQIEEIRLLLFLAIMSKNITIGRGANAGHYMATSENFIVTIQNFRVDEEYIGERSGTIVSINAGGYKIGEHKFYAPSYLTTPMRFNYDKRFLSILLKIRNSQKRFYSKVLRGTGLFSESYYNDHQISQNARIMLQCGGFEALLDLPDDEQRKEFKEVIKKETVDSNEKELTYWFETKRGKKREDKGALKVIWADRFFTLRNKIIHGSKIDHSEFVFKKKQGHMHIALMFFILLIKTIINRKLRRKLFYDKITWKKVKDDLESYEGFEYDDRELEYMLYAGLLKSKTGKVPLS